MNEVKLSGKLYRPELKATPSGMVLAKFSIGNTKKVKGEFVTNFFNCVCFKDVAEQVSQLPEKAKINIEGILTQDRWEKDGKKMSIVKIIVNKIYSEAQPIQQQEEPIQEMNLEDMGV